MFMGAAVGGVSRAFIEAFIIWLGRLCTYSSGLHAALFRFQRLLILVACSVY